MCVYLLFFPKKSVGIRLVSQEHQQVLLEQSWVRSNCIENLSHRRRLLL